MLSYCILALAPVTFGDIDDTFADCFFHYIGYRDKYCLHNLLPALPTWKFSLEHACKVLFSLSKNEITLQ